MNQNPPAISDETQAYSSGFVPQGKPAIAGCRCFLTWLLYGVISFFCAIVVRVGQVFVEAGLGRFGVDKDIIGVVSGISGMLLFGIFSFLIFRFLVVRLVRDWVLVRR